MNIFNKIEIKLMSEKRWEETLMHAITEYDTPSFEALLKLGRNTNFTAINKKIESETPLSRAIVCERERVSLLLQAKTDPNILLGQRYSGNPFGWVPVSPVLLALEHHTQPGMGEVYIALRKAGGKLYGHPVNENKLKPGQQWLSNTPEKIQTRLKFKKLEDVYEQWEAAYQKQSLQSVTEKAVSPIKRLKI